MSSSLYHETLRNLEQLEGIAKRAWKHAPDMFARSSLSLLAEDMNRVFAIVENDEFLIEDAERLCEQNPSEEEVQDMRNRTEHHGREDDV